MKMGKPKLPRQRVREELFDVEYTYGGELVMELTLACKSRDPKAKPNALRRQGLLPAVLYGHNGTESVSLTVDQKAAEFLLRRVTVNSTPIDLEIPDLPWQGKVLLKEVQSHPWNTSIYHLSFFAVQA